MDSEEQSMLPPPIPSVPSQMLPSAGSNNASVQAPSTQGRPLPQKIYGLMEKNIYPLSMTTSSSANGLFPSTPAASEHKNNLGCLNLSALSAHPSPGTLEADWWKSTNVYDKIGATSIFPPFLGLHPVYVSSFKNMNPVGVPPAIPGNNNTMKRRHAPSLAASATAGTTSPAIIINEERSPFTQERTHQQVQPHRPPSTVSFRQSASVTNSSIEGEESSSSSSGLDNTQGEAGQSSDCAHSHSAEDAPPHKKVKCLTGQREEKKTLAADPNLVKKNSYCTSVPSSNHCQAHHPPVRPPQSTAVFLQGSGHSDLKDHLRVNIQLPGPAGGPSHRELLPHKASPESIPPFSSPMQSSVSSLFSTTKHLSLCSDSPLSHYTSLEHPHISSGASLPVPSLTKPFTKNPSCEANHQDGMSQNCEKAAHVSVIKEKQQTCSKEHTKHVAFLQPQSQVSGNADLLNLHSHKVLTDSVHVAPPALITKAHAQSCIPSSHLYPSAVSFNRGNMELCSSSASSCMSAATSLPLAKQNLTFYGRKDLTQHQSPEKDTGRHVCDDNERSSLSVSNHVRVPERTKGDPKETVEIKENASASQTPVKPVRASVSIEEAYLNASSSCTHMNLQIPKTQGLLDCRSLKLDTTMRVSKEHCISPSSLPSGAKQVLKKKKKVTDDRHLRLPLEMGWKRQTWIKSVAGRLQGEVVYVAPSGKRLRHYPDVARYLARNGVTGISRDNFNLSNNIRIGDFYEARHGAQGLQWFLLAKSEISPVIKAVNGKCGHDVKSEPQLEETAVKHTQHEHPVCDAKLLRKMEAQEIAQQAAQIKMLKKLEREAMTRAAKEAKRQQAIAAAEERRKKREHLKFLKEQERQKKKEDAASARIIKAEQRNKEKQMRRLQTVIQKQQDLERYRVDMEKERQRQHTILMKALQGQRKAEEKERLKKEKLLEKRLKRERKREIRRLQLEKAKELKKPKEDMCLSDHKPLPEFSRIPGLVLPGNSVSDCLMVLQFLYNFGDVLRLNLNASMLTLENLQEGLLNIGNNMHMVQDLLVTLVSAAVSDPGLPAGQKIKTIFGENLSEVEMNSDNVSEILQIFMAAHSGKTDLADSLRTTAFQAHTPSQKVSMLAFLVNKLCCSKVVISEIHKKIDYISNLRRDKRIVEEKLRKLRGNDNKPGGPRVDCTEAEGKHGNCFLSRKRQTKDVDSEEEEDEGSDDQDNNEEEEGVDKVTVKNRDKKKTQKWKHEDHVLHVGSVGELDREIEKTAQLQTEIRQKLFDASHSLHSTMIGQDRYKRRYWVLPHCGGVFVEGVDTGECTSADIMPNLPATASFNTTPNINNTQFTESQGELAADLCIEICENLRSEANERPTLSGTPLPFEPNCTLQPAEGHVQVAPKEEEVTATKDLPFPRPIPKEMLHGWWRVSDAVSLQNLLKSLHSRGIREKGLQKQIQKQMELMSQLCIKGFEVIDLEKHKLVKKTMENWSVDEQAREVDLSLLRQVEALEREVISASLHVQGWNPAKPWSDCKDLACLQRTGPSLLKNSGQGENVDPAISASVVHRQNSLLDAAITRLAELESHIERRNEVDVGLKLWQKALSQVHSSAQLSLCIQQLRKSIVWENAVIKTKGVQAPQKTDLPTPGEDVKHNKPKGSNKTNVHEELSTEKDAGIKVRPIRGTREFKKGKDDNYNNPATAVKKAKRLNNGRGGLEVCRVLLVELMAHKDAWPFLTPVNCKAIPGYRKVIKNPMDFSIIKKKITTNQYSSPDYFKRDVKLVLENCKKFNEDNSNIGRAGHNMRTFFNKRWTELQKFKE